MKLQIKSGDSIRLLKASDVAKGFSSSMFVTLVGVTFLFGMASQNGTLDLQVMQHRRQQADSRRI